MNEIKNDSTTWATKQIWIKDVLKKSDTELLDISKTPRNAM